MLQRYSVVPLLVYGLTMSLSSAMTTEVWACAICIGFPEKTAADYLVEGHCVVLARQDKQNPFAYAPCEVLKGALNGAEIDLLVDSTTRRFLQSDAKRRVLLVQDESCGDWRNLGIASENYLAVVRRIVMFGETWRGKDGALRRLNFFLPLFGHDDPRIAQVAYLEMGRAPYPTIQQLGRIAPREAYAGLLSDPKYFEWRSLAILLLAQSENPRDKRRILDSFGFASRFRITTNLAAWATAAIEIEGGPVVESIEDEYFRRLDRSPEEIQAVLKALSMHGSLESSGLQDRIVASYRSLLKHYPQVAPVVARDLFAWKRHDLVEELSARLREDSGYKTSERQWIRRYLRAAGSSEELALVDD